VRPEGLGKLIEIIHLIGSRTRDLPIYNIAVSDRKRIIKYRGLQETAWIYPIVDCQVLQLATRHFYAGLRFTFDERSLE
jgi:hypothetical protein